MIVKFDYTREGHIYMVYIKVKIYSSHEVWTSVTFPFIQSTEVKTKEEQDNDFILNIELSWRIFEYLKMSWYLIMGLI